MVYLFSNFNDVVHCFEEEILNFTIKRYPIKHFDLMLNPEDPDLFFVGQKVLYDRYKDKFKFEMKHLTVGTAEPKGILLVMRLHEGFVYRVIVNSKAKKLDSKSREVIESRRIYKRNRRG